MSNRISTYQRMLSYVIKLQYLSKVGKICQFIPLFICYLAIIGVSFPENHTMKAACSFLADVLNKKDKYSQLDSVIQKIAPPLYDIMLKVTCLPVYW